MPPLDAPTLANAAIAAAAGVAIAAACGLRAFLPLLALAAGARLGFIHLDPRAAWLASNASIVALAVATVVEIAADKVPLLDHALDVVATFVRPAAAALAAWASFAGIHPALAVAAALILGAGAFGVHVVKAKTRLGSTAFTMGLANPFLSFAEDAFAGGLSALAVLVPIAALVLVVLGGWLIVGAARGRPRA